MIKFSVGFVSGLVVGLLLWYAVGKHQSRQELVAEKATQSIVASPPPQMEEKKEVSPHAPESSVGVSTSAPVQKAPKTIVKYIPMQCPMIPENNSHMGANVAVANQNESDPPKMAAEASPLTEDLNPVVQENVEQSKVAPNESQARKSVLQKLFEVYASIGAFFHRSDGRDVHNNTNATLLSDTSVYADAGVKVHAFSNPREYLHFRYSLSDYRYSAGSTSAVIADQNVFASNLHVGFGGQMRDWISTEAFVEGVQEFFYFSPVLNTIEFDSDWVAKLGLLADFRLVRKNKWYSDFHITGTYFDFGKIIEHGYDVAGGPVFGYGPVSVHVDFQFQNKKTSTLDLNTLQLLSFVRYEFK